MSATKYEWLYENSPLAIFEMDLEGNFTSANPAMVRLFGYSSEAALLEASGDDTLFANVGDRDDWLETLHREGKLLNHRRSMRNRNGECLETQQTVYPIKDVQGRCIGYQGTVTDLTEVLALTRQLSHHARHDSLTALPNRQAFEDRVQELIESTRTDLASHAVCYFDLDQFKVVNDTFGHAAGDDLLRELSTGLATRVSGRDMLARIGGDEFALLLTNRDLDQAAVIAGNLLEWIRSFRFSWQGRHVDISASIGVVPMDASTESRAELLAAADAACFAAKEKGRNRVHIQEEDDQTVTRRLTEMRSVIELKQALQEGRLTLYRQAIRPLRERLGSEERFELLVRMVDSDGKLLYPGQFLPAAEKYNLGSQVDRWVVQAFCEWFNSTPHAAATLAYGAINLSGHSLGNDEFLSFVRKQLDSNGVAGRYVCFEVTETTAINNLRSAQRFIAELKERGCRFALDDFGSGVSSFGYLKNLPVDFIKIDGMFIRKLKEDVTDRVIVKSISEVAHSLGLLTIAEFVEDEDTLSLLAEVGIDFAQGYAVGYPEPLWEKECPEQDTVTMPGIIAARS